MNQNPYGYPPPQQAYGAPPPHQQQGYGFQPYYHKPPQTFNTSSAPQQPHYDPEAAQAAAYASAFAENKIRSAFVRKVLCLVFLMLATTIGVAAVFLFVDPVNEYVAGKKYEVNGTTYRMTPQGQWVFWTSWALTLVTMIALLCFQGIRRAFPWNYIAMFVLTAVLSVQVGCICAWWSVQVVLIAVAVTGAAVFGLTLAAVFIPWDLTKRGNILGIASIVVLFVVIITIIIGFFYTSKWWYLALSVVIALLFAAYFMYDLQMILGGKNKQYSLSPDEWCFAATQLYLDIVFLFLNLLQIIGIASN